MRKTPEQWDEVHVGDILMHEPSEQIFRVKEMTFEHGYYTRVTVSVMNLLTRSTTMWFVDAANELNELAWIGEG